MNVNQLVKYSIVGGISFVADYSVFYVLVAFVDVDYLVASIYGYILGVFVNYTLARKYVYSIENTIRKSMELLGVYLFSTVGLLIHQIVIYIMVEFFINNVYISKVLASIAVLFWNYYAKKIYIYREIVK